MEKLNIKTASDLKYWYNENNHGNFFDRKTMAFFGDKMANYGIINNGVIVTLTRRKPVNNGLQGSAYFCAFTAERLTSQERIRRGK